MDEKTRDQIERALGGDRSAFEALIRTYSRPLYARAYSVIRCRPDAEDVVQDTFLKAWRSRDGLKDPDRFPQWIFSIARNRALDLVRKRRPEELGEGTAGELQGPDRPPWKRMEGDEVRARIFAALDTLPEKHRTAVTLRYLQGLDYKGIERELGISNGAVRGILARTLTALRKALKDWIVAGERPEGALRTE